MVSEHFHQLDLFVVFFLQKLLPVYPLLSEFGHFHFRLTFAAISVERDALHCAGIRGVGEMEDGSPSHVPSHCAGLPIDYSFYEESK